MKSSLQRVSLLVSLSDVVPVTNIPESMLAELCTANRNRMHVLLERSWDTLMKVVSELKFCLTVMTELFE